MFSNANVFRNNPLPPNKKINSTNYILASKSYNFLQRMSQWPEPLHYLNLLLISVKISGIIQGFINRSINCSINNSKVSRHIVMLETGKYDLERLE